MFSKINPSISRDQYDEVYISLADDVEDELLKLKNDFINDNTLKSFNFSLKCYEYFLSSSDKKSVPVSMVKPFVPFKKYLIGGYEKIAKKRKNEYIKELRGNAIGQRCPYCFLSDCKSLDHYLPKEFYPNYSFYINNLIPTCLNCNTIKGKDYPMFGFDRYINPYYDDLLKGGGGEPPVYISLIDSEPFDYEILVSDYLSESLKESIEYHFIGLDLKKRLARVIYIELKKMEDEITQLKIKASEENMIFYLDLLRDSRTFVAWRDIVIYSVLNKKCNAWVLNKWMS